MYVVVAVVVVVAVTVEFVTHLTDGKPLVRFVLMDCYSQLQDF
jgi:hypothetical protein